MNLIKFTIDLPEIMFPLAISSLKLRKPNLEKEIFRTNLLFKELGLQEKLLWLIFGNSDEIGSETLQCQLITLMILIEFFSIFDNKIFKMV